ncbi:MAG TPA: hypothetical protein EYQ34_01295 [Acidimicrobiia bacterium]|nr:hypothetical protein [Acidimicrobiia bacterium]
MRSQIYAHDHVPLREGEPSMTFSELLSLFSRAVEDADVNAFLELFHGDVLYAVTMCGSRRESLS